MSSMNVKKSKTILYKRVEFVGQSHLNLQTLLTKVLTAIPKPGERTEKVGTDQVDSGIRRVLGSHKLEQTMLCAAIYQYEKGKDLVFVIQDNNANEYTLEQQNPASTEKDAPKREVLEASAYIGVLNNHVLLVQAPGLRSRVIENHINWLLKKDTSILPEGCAVSLSDEPTKEAREKIETASVREFQIGTPLNTEMIPTTGVAQVQSSTHKINLAGKGKAILSGLLGADALNNLNLEESLDDANIEVVLKLRYARKTTDAGHAVLDQLARATRHMDQEDTRIVTTSGAVINGDNLKLGGKLSVITNNGVIDANDLYASMFAWLTERIQDGSVSSDG